jgi:hypothetical protein
MLWNGNVCGRNSGSENLHATIPSTHHARSKQQENVAYSTAWANMITQDARYICGIKSRISMSKPAFNKKKTLFASKIGLKLKEETSKVLYFYHSCVWC